MFANPTNVGISQRVVATLVACAVAMVSIGFYNLAQAANLTSVSDTLTDSQISVVSNHTIAFTIPAGSTGVAAAGTITVTFPAGFALGSVAFGDMDLTIGGASQTLAAAAAGATWGATKTGQVVTFTSGTGTATAGQAIIIKIGTNATVGGTGVNRITNPTAGSYELVITAGASDTGRTQVAILNNVQVTAKVNTTFTFTVTGLATSTAINGTTTTGSTSPVKIPFGTLTANQPKSLAQKLAVVTNAIAGFVVTVQTSGNLKSSNGAVIDNFANGADTSTPTAWATNLPTNNISSNLTWGHWGFTSNDSDLSVPFGANQYEAASTTARTVFTHSGPADGTTVNKGTANVGYQVQITPLQEAADDYNTTLTSIATPTF